MRPVRPVDKAACGNREGVLAIGPSNLGRKALIRTYAAAPHPNAALPKGADQSGQRPVAVAPGTGPVAAFANASTTRARVPTAGATSGPSPCRLASQLGSLYESQVVPD